MAKRKGSFDVTEAARKGCFAPTRDDHGVSSFGHLEIGGFDFDF